MATDDSENASESNGGGTARNFVRYDQTFPELTPQEIDRMRRFGEIRTYKDGERLFEAGKPGRGMVVLLSGRVALVDGFAEGDVETLLIPPDRLRALLVAEAVLGERIMRALILRRVNLIQGGVGGPVLIGPSDSPSVARLQNFLSRNGFPQHLLDPDRDHDAEELIKRYSPLPDDWPLVVTIDGTVLRNPSENDLAHALGDRKSVV